LDPVADAAYVSVVAVRDNVYVIDAEPVDSVFKVGVVRVLLSGSYIVRATSAPETGVPDVLTVTVIVTGLPFL